jgi:hypothetical protein
MSPLVSLVLSLAVALVTALVLGGLWGRLALQSATVRGFTNFMTDLRGSLLILLLAVGAVRHQVLPLWAVVALGSGLTQSVALARWTTRRSGEWAPAILGGISLGESGSRLAWRRARRRGAVAASLGLTAIHWAAGWLVLTTFTKEPALPWAHGGGVIVVASLTWLALIGASPAFSLTNLKRLGGRGKSS